MKRLPEKMVMAAIILSCGVVVSQMEPMPQHVKAKRVTAGGLAKWQAIPAAVAERPRSAGALAVR